MNHVQDGSSYTKASVATESPGDCLGFTAVLVDILDALQPFIKSKSIAFRSNAVIFLITGGSRFLVVILNDPD